MGRISPVAVYITVALKNPLTEDTVVKQFHEEDAQSCLQFSILLYSIIWSLVLILLPPKK